MKVNIENGFLDFDRIGDGNPILFIHGYPLSRKIWEPQIDGLSSYASLVSVDLRGHGESYPFDGAYTMDMLAGDCIQVLAELRIKTPVVVCGLSMGGYITMAMYRRDPGIFKGMILTSTRAGSDSPEGKANRDASIKNALENGPKLIADGMIRKMFSPSSYSAKPELVKTVYEIMANTSVQGIIGALQGMRDRIDSTPMLTIIKCPVLIVHGADDQLIPIKEAELMDQQIPDSRLSKIENAGHLVNMEQPELYNQAARDFVESLG